MRCWAGPAPPRVAPGLRAGRGLKRRRRGLQQAVGQVAPGLRAGRGLKLDLVLLARLATGSCARPSGRARIETPCPRSAGRTGPSCARPSGRARIETFRRRDILPPNASVAPGLRAGRGLKRVETGDADRQVVVAPGLRAGRGLKQARDAVRVQARQSCARPSGRARIETTWRPPGGCCTTWLRPAFGPGED